MCLKDVVVCVIEGFREIKIGYFSKMVVDDFNFLKKKVEEDLKCVEKDNDMIYFSMCRCFCN